MAAQTGFYDTLKSTAGKVFSYLASITLTGTDGKTITCTQDTSLDEATTMSSKAPKNGAVLTSAVVNSAYIGAGSLGSVPASATKTITITTGDTEGVIEVSFGFFGSVNGTTRAVLKILAGGKFANVLYYQTSDAVRVVDNWMALGVTTQAAGSITFTVQETAGNQVIYPFYTFTSSVPITVSIA